MTVMADRLIDGDLEQSVRVRTVGVVLAEQAVGHRGHGDSTFFWSDWSGEEAGADGGSKARAFRRSRTVASTITM